MSVFAAPAAQRIGVGRTTEEPMLKVAVLIWIMLGPTLAGVAMVAIVSVPHLAGMSEILIPWLCGGGFVLAIPFSFIIAKKIMANMSPAA